jgi:hypothetical protein
VARWTNDELLQLALSARKDTDVREGPPGQMYQYRLASLMVQAINHATEHRVQIATITTQLGMEPPDMSGWQYMVEIGEFQELGAGAEGGPERLPKVNSAKALHVRVEAQAIRLLQGWAVRPRRIKELQNAAEAAFQAGECYTTDVLHIS